MTKDEFNLMLENMAVYQAMVNEKISDLIPENRLTSPQH